MLSIVPGIYTPLPLWMTERDGERKREGRGVRERDSERKRERRRGGRKR